MAHFVDDVITFSKDPMAIMQELEKSYIMKGVATILLRERCGRDGTRMGTTWDPNRLLRREVHKKLLSKAGGKVRTKGILQGKDTI
jgi:hypothetical protein